MLNNPHSFNHLCHVSTGKSQRLTMAFGIEIVGEVLDGGKILKLKGLDYKSMAGTYRCTVETRGGKNSSSADLIVYCK